LLIDCCFNIQSCAALAERDFLGERRLTPVWRIDPQHLRYEARTVTGRLYDAFELRRDAKGGKQRTELTEGRITPRDCPRAQTAKGRADRCWE